MVVLVDKENVTVENKVVGREENDKVTLGEKDCVKKPEELCVRLTKPLVANGLIVTEIEGVREGDVEEVA